MCSYLRLHTVSLFYVSVLDSVLKSAAEHRNESLHGNDLLLDPTTVWGLGAVAKTTKGC